MVDIRPSANQQGRTRGGSAPKPRRKRDGRGRRVRAREPVSTPAVPRAAIRRYRQTVARVDLWTVLKISICFYLCALVVLLAAGAVTWWLASAIGLVGSVEEFLGDLLEAEDFRFLSWRILRGATLIGLVVVCLMVVVTVLAAALYNLFSGLIGGVEVTVTEEDEGFA